MENKNEHECSERGRLTVIETEIKRFCKFEGETMSDIKHIKGSINKMETNHLPHIYKQLNWVVRILVMFLLAVIGALLKK